MNLKFEFVFDRESAFIKKMLLELLQASIISENKKKTLVAMLALIDRALVHIFHLYNYLDEQILREIELNNFSSEYEENEPIHHGQSLWELGGVPVSRATRL